MPAASDGTAGRVATLYYMPTTSPTSVRLAPTTLEQLDELRELIYASDPAPWNGKLPSRTATISYAVHTVHRALTTPRQSRP
jgi:hypothetical protein